MTHILFAFASGVIITLVIVWVAVLAFGFSVWRHW